MKKLNLVFGALFLIGTHCFASGWVSSGGGVFQDAKNPWFVKNTTDVTYCVQVDTAGFSAPQSLIESTLADGFAYWKSEFAKTNDSVEGSFELGTQNFHLVACDANTDIQFLFGYKTLTAAQVAYLQDPQKYIGVTVRTDYDFKNLKAKGFVFFSSDTGSNAYQNTGDLVQNAWTRPQILKYAILHELGHVFGIPHMGNGLMSEVFLNQILNKKLVDAYQNTPIESFLRPSSSLEVCDGLSARPVWFSGKTGYQCVVISMPTVTATSWKVSVKKTSTSELEDVGDIKNVMPNSLDQRNKPVCLLQLDDTQTVFTSQETLFRSFMTGPLMLESGFSGVFVAKGGTKAVSVYASMTPTSLSIQGLTSQNKVEPVFIFNSPLSILMMSSPTP